MYDVEDIQQKSLSSLKWGFLQGVLLRVVPSSTLVILARLLTPEDLGVVAMGMIIVTFASEIFRMGLDEALIQKEGELKESFNVVFWMNIALGIVVAVIIILIAPLFSRFFNEPRLTAVLQVLSTSIFIASLSTAQEAILYREFLFKKLMWLTLVATLVPFLVAIPLAILGFSYWVWIISYVVASIIKTGLLWYRSHWRPHGQFNTKVAKFLLTFGSWVFMIRLGGWGCVTLDRLFVGRFLATSKLGIYSMSREIMDMTTGFFISPFIPIIYSAFSRLNALGGDKLRDSFIKHVKVVSSVAIPSSIGLCLISKAMVPIVLGDKWLEVIPLITIMSIVVGMSWISAVNAQFYNAAGRPDVSCKISFYALAYYIPIYWFTAKLGLIPFAWGKASSIIFVFVHVWMTEKFFNIRSIYFWECIRYPLFASIIMGVVVFILVELLSPYDSGEWQEWLKLVVILSIGIVIYICMLRLISRHIYVTLMKMGKSFFMSSKFCRSELE